MKINPAILLATVVSLGVLIWVLRTSEYSNIDMTQDYVAPIQDMSGASLSGSNLVVMDPATGNMKLAPVDNFDTNARLNLNKIVSEKVPGQVTEAIDTLRGKPGQTKYVDSLRDLRNAVSNGLGLRYTKTESDNNFVKRSTPYYIARYATRELAPIYLGSHKSNADIFPLFKHGDENKQRFVLVSEKIRGTGSGILDQYTKND